MVLTEIINVIASLFGYDITEFNAIKGIDDSVLKLEKDMNNASASAEKLKRGLRSFDKLNNITTPTASTGGVGVGGGIDPRIWEAFNSAYDDYFGKLTDVQMKATKIRDAIMEWLGFTKQIDTETGKVSFKFDHITTGTVISALFVGGALLLGLAKIVSFLQTINKVLGISKLPSVFATLKNILPVLGKTVTILGSLVGIFVGSKGIYNIMKNVNRETEKGSKTYKEYKKNIGLVTLSATALGTVLGGPLGAVIGLITGLTLSGIVAYEGYKASIESIAKSNVFGDLTISLEQWNNILTNNGLEIENYKEKLSTLQQSLGTMNTSFQSSAEQLDLYSYKFGLLGQKISEEDGVKITSAIQNVADQSISIIQASTDFSLQLWGDTFKNATTISEEEQKNILNSIMNYGTQQQNEIKTAQNNITKTYDNAIKTRGYLTDEEYKYIQTQLEKIRTLTQKEMTKNQSEIEFLKLQFADENLKLDEESYKNFQTALDSYIDDQKDKIKENYRIRLQDAQYYYDNGVIKENEYNKLLKEAYEDRINDEKALQKEVDDIQEKVYKSLDERYGKIIDDTSEVAKKERSIIENIFKNINMDTSELERNFKNAGTILKRALGQGLDKVQIGGNMIIGFNTTGVYADGGLPPVGQLFVANERGAELVGNIGGQSFVANQNQVVDLLDRKLADADGGIQNATFIVQVGDEKIGEVTLNNLQKMAKSNGKPITIGV